MENAIYHVSYKLKKGTSIEEFLAAAKALNDQFIAKQKGYMSSQQLNDGDTWADQITFATMDDAKNFLANAGNVSETAQKFYSLINLNSCKQHLFLVKQHSS